MKKSEWFINAILNDAYKSKSWIMKCFSITVTDPKSKNRRPGWNINSVTGSEWGMFSTRDDNSRKSIVSPIADYQFTNAAGDIITLDDYTYNDSNPEPPFRLLDKIELPAGSLPNVTRDIITTYGNVIANALLLIYPFGSRIEFITGRFSVKDVENIIEPRLRSDSEEDDENVPKDAVFVKEYIKFTKGASMLAGISTLCVPSATRKSMTSHPDIPKLKAKLLEENKDNLDDPLTITKIEKALVEKDKEHTKGDLSDGFILGGKARNVVRKKSYSMLGLVTAFGDGSKGTLVPTSLEEGIDLKYMPAMVSDSREGSYDRGADTALGGDEVKKLLDISQNTYVAEKDCGTKETLDVLVTPEISSLMIACNIMVKDDIVTLNEENIGNYIGKTVKLRTPYTCNTADSSVCAVCVGENYAKRPTSLSTAIGGFGSKYMYIFMASMHAKEMKSAVYDINKHTY